MKFKILIVEDEEWIAEDMKEVLEKDGYEVTGIADSYELALLSLRKNQPDLVLLDIRLNGPGSGVDIAREINDRYKVPFLFLSSHIDPKTMEEVLEESPHSILTKPCKPVDLLAGVKLALSKGKIEISANTQNSSSDDSFFVKSEHAYQKIEVSKLYYIKGEGSYVKIQLDNERLVLRATLKDFEFLESHEKLMRVHRSYIINLDYIDKIHSKFLEIKEFEIPLTKEGRELIMLKINTVR